MTRSWYASESKLAVPREIAIFLPLGLGPWLWVWCLGHHSSPEAGIQSTNKHLPQSAGDSDAVSAQNGQTVTDPSLFLVSLHTDFWVNCPPFDVSLWSVICFHTRWCLLFLHRVGEFAFSDHDWVPNPVAFPCPWPPHGFSDNWCPLGEAGSSGAANGALEWIQP